MLQKRLRGAPALSGRHHAVWEFAPLNPAGFVKVDELGPVMGVPYAEKTIWAMVARGEFPAPLKLSARCTAWKIASVLAWLEEQAAKAQATDNFTGRKLTEARLTKREAAK